MISRIYAEAQAKKSLRGTSCGSVVETRRVTKEFVLSGKSQVTPKMQA